MSRLISTNHLRQIPRGENAPPLREVRVSPIYTVVERGEPPLIPWAFGVVIETFKYSSSKLSITIEEALGILITSENMPDKQLRVTKHRFSERCGYHKKIHYRAVGALSSLDFLLQVRKIVFHDSSWRDHPEDAFRPWAQVELDEISGL